MKTPPLEELLLKKDFSNLSLEEKQFALSQITKAEYNDMRFILTNSKDCFKRDFEELKINDTSKIKLSQAFKQKYIKQNIQSNRTSFCRYNKRIIKPVYYIGVVIIAIGFFINNSNNKQTLSQDIRNVTSFLNGENAFLKINEKYSSDLIDSNKFHKDSIIEMNNYLHIKTDGLYLIPNKH